MKAWAVVELVVRRTKRTSITGKWQRHPLALVVRLLLDLVREATVYVGMHLAQVSVRNLVITSRGALSAPSIAHPKPRKAKPTALATSAVVTIAVATKSMVVLRRLWRTLPNDL